MANAAEPLDPPTAAAKKAAAEIRREAILPSIGPAGRPLPLASHWNVGTVPGTFTPDHQIELLQQGSHILPWMNWPSGDPDSENFKAYYERLLAYYAALDLPISIRGTQWNAMLVKKSYREGPEADWAGVILPDGKRLPRLSPFGAVEPWKDPAAVYVDTPAMRRAQEIYPDPPLVIWASNNEAPDLRWAKHGPLEEQSKRYLEKYGAGRSDDFKRQVVGEGWVERFGVMFQAMRAALASDAWRKNVRFVGYGAFGPSHYGRSSGWEVYSLHCDRWTSPDWHVWDGGSPSYYTHNWNQNRDYWVFSTQVEAMNWVFMQEEAWQVNPNFWFEMSTWDGNESKAWSQGVGAADDASLVDASSRPLTAGQRKQLDPADLKKSKTLQYLQLGQDYPPARQAGWVQYGMWILRPRVVREFRGHATRLEPIEPYWRETVAAVDRVYAHPVLADFWRHGELVANPAHRHPYQVNIPAKQQDIPRWYLLDTNLDPPRPWTLETELPVFSLALVRGEGPTREWLVYAHSPLQDRKQVEVTIPGRGAIQIDVPRQGAFYRIDADALTPQRIGE
ncbi:hypothetical protein [Lignipirellula cremea]|nr:hypothetical protein [Lignipirellula cremea]